MVNGVDLRENLAEFFFKKKSFIDLSTMDLPTLHN